MNIVDKISQAEWWNDQPADGQLLAKALANLIERCGGSAIMLGPLHGRSGTEEPQWFAEANFQAIILNRRGPTLATACMKLTERLFRDAMCRCGLRSRIPGSHVTPGERRCTWKLDAEQAVWKPGCDAPSIPMPEGTQRGDYTAISRAFQQRIPKVDE